MDAPITAGDDPFWYKDAVIYQLHVKSFFDANNDGIGDFPGLISKLDYIADLGATAIWLLPFYPSPRRDDGYDIALYEGVSPDYGTMEDARRFIEAAHARGIRVITELVVNHTSDQHPWFQAARAAPKGSPERNYYVWADDDAGYSGTRIIFLDTEKSNWTYDPVAGQYYWHRFYSHQPDLNFDNPEVLERILSVMRFWLDIGVDGLRLDAVPYLIEREGTSNENLPETHDILKRIRAHLEERYTGRMLLAEANMWPEDTQQYFGENGDECHMAFHFPLMPRMYMAIAKEDRFPITDILRQTPAIPESCQWAIFLRNHDELTLEMVTDAERDYLWTVYAADRRARLNLGIRRRLAPLLQRDRRRIELMNALLLSMPGTPVIYYGDEIGMGDNIHLGDRDGVRTPMQWSPDRNGGFSKADPELLVLPPIQDPLYGYYALNVEAQLRDPHSLLNWTRRVLAIRKRHPSMGRGTFRLLYPGNRKILAYLRSYEGETILCVANLSQTLQAVELDLSEFDQRVPVEMAGGTPFPPVGRLPYLLTVPAYGFYAFNLSTQMAEPSWHSPPPEQLPEFVTLVLRGGLADVVSERHRPTLEREALPAYVRRRRWFASRNEPVGGVRVAWAMPLPRAGNNVFLAEIAIDLPSGTERYVVPLAIAWEDQQPSALAVQLALTRVRQGRRVGFLTDALTLDSMPHAVVRAMRSGTALPLPDGGELRFVATPRLADVEISPDAPIHRVAAEEATSSIVIEDCASFKVIRRTLFGLHPESEMVRYLTEQDYANTAPLLGEVVRFDPEGRPAVLALLLGYVRNQGDAWNWLVDQLRRALTASTQGGTDIERSFEEQLSGVPPFLRALGRRLAEFHTVMARPSANPAFGPAAADADQVQAWANAARAAVRDACAVLSATRAWSSDQVRREAEAILSAGDALEAAAARLAAAGEGAPLSRIHGAFHFGQVLVSGGDAYIVNFDGYAHTPIEARRTKDSPWRDVAGLIRSIDAAAAHVDYTGSEVHGLAEAWQRHAVFEHFSGRAVRAFLSGYQEAVTATSPSDRQLLDLFLLERAAETIGAEAAGRPAAFAYAVRSLYTMAIKHAGAAELPVAPELEGAPA
ncbi:maltose alpha-D-glucosyltransferase [Aquabacter spiritensis]|uniref:Maltokinase n=1 Tax=Aquabacter spiritensis TaxID=933073 RepID=A0A4R3M2R3_9HYPH|nr:maltose alpha-D-glucosyltransferase [Aquabacter spiritensis]TCT05537.1 trehalose synthase [Aquabacter spiritensis]